MAEAEVWAAAVHAACAVVKCTKAHGVSVLGVDGTHARGVIDSCFLRSDSTELKMKLPTLFAEENTPQPPSSISTSVPRPIISPICAIIVCTHRGYG